TGSTYTGLDVCGPLQDGNYQMAFNPNTIGSLHPTPANPITPEGPANFFRLFGDFNGVRMVTTTGVPATDDRAAFLAAYPSVITMPNYREYFNFDNNATVDGADYTQLLRRFQRAGIFPLT